jgi:hypothetical protein
MVELINDKQKIALVNGIWMNFKSSTLTNFQKDKLSVTLNLYLNGYKTLNQVIRYVKHLRETNPIQI